jgi:preprotein translocase subunit Sec63
LSERDIGRPLRDLDVSYRPVALRAYVEQARQLLTEPEHTNRQLESAYEELQSTNEELQSTNEGTGDDERGAAPRSTGAAAPRSSGCSAVPYAARTAKATARC